jgi:regulation of enolase protein 1 (concanavalin A-like superfamily)
VRETELLNGCRGRALASGLRWLNEPPEWEAGPDGLLIVPAAPSDFFRPYGGTPSDNCSLLYTEVTGDFTAAAQVRAELADFGDAGALTVRATPERWAKLCLERSPAGEVSVVSVVTDGWSDDGNGELLARPECHLRLTRRGQVFAMHHSLDGSRWRFVRTFGLELPEQVMVGIHAQAPFTAGCRVVFRRFAIGPEPVADFRSGE